MINDFRFAFRQLWKSPSFTIAAVAVLALGIGVNTAIFSLVHTMLFQAPGYTRPTEIVQLYSQDKKNPKSFRMFSYPTFQDIRRQNTVFTDVMAHHVAIVGVGEKGNTRRTIASLVSSNYFSVLGVAPVHGRAFLPAEETLGRPAHVAIVSDRYSKKQGRDAAVVGSEILINGRPFTVVGVMPEGFTGTSQIIGPEVWLPLSVHDDVTNDFQRPERQLPLSERGAPGRLLVIGRLKPGLTAAAADPQLKTLAANLEQAYPVEQKDQTFMAAPLPRFAANDPRGDEGLSAIGALLLGMAALVLLVACLNLANMLLARGAARRKEIAVRLALGARRGRIVRQLLTEGFVLALLGGAFGVLLALWAADLLVASLGKTVPVDIVVLTGPTPALLAATFGFCLLGTLFFGVGPALKLSRATALDDLKEHAGEDVSRRRWKFLPRNPLVVVQFAFSLALVTTAALFIRGARTAANIDTGLNTERLFLVEVDASLRGYGRAHTQQLYRMIGEKLAALPGVESASISATVPFGMFNIGKRVQRAGSPPPPDGNPETAADGLDYSTCRSVGADYFKTIGLPLLRGRSFTAAEAMQPGGPAVAIIDDRLAQKLWPQGDALGQRVQFAAEMAATADSGGRSEAGKVDEADGQIRAGESIEVVGIVRHTPDAFFGEGPGSGTAVYVPFGRGFQKHIYFLAKFSALPAGSEASAADLLRRSIMSADAELPIISIKTFEQHLEGNLQFWAIKAGAALFSVFGMLALGLAVVGLYGVTAYSVARRTREIGIRMALGAQRAAVQQMILGEGAAMLTTGLVLGLLLAFVTGKLVSSMLYQVSSLDPIAFTVAPVVLALAGLFATWLPARRATLINPIEALRTE